MGGGGGGGGGTIDEQAKIDLLKNAGVQMNAWRALPRATRHANLVTWAKSQPGVADAGIAASSDTVWILYTDGDGSVYLDNKGLTVPPPRRIVPKANDMPGDVRAYTLYSLEHDKFPDVTDSVRLDLNNQGYNATRIENPTVEQLIALNGAGVLFWQCHGGVVNDNYNGVKTTSFGFGTGQQATKALSLTYQSYRKNAELLVSGREIVAPDGTVTVIPVYMITAKFVKNHLSLAPNAFVAIDGCTAATKEMYEAFQVAKAGTYVGWDGLSGPRSGERFTLMFDRLLGANVEPPLSQPLERPFDIDAVQNWMQTKNYDLDPSVSGYARLKWFYKAGAKSLMLRPTILRILEEANDQQWPFMKFLVEGTFGPDPGAANRKVTWGGVPVTVLSWNELEGIKIKPPAKPYPQGYVQVERNGRWSNRVPLTEWTLPVTYTLTGKGTLQCKITFTLKFRVDVRGVRFRPEDPIQGYPMVFVHMDDSTGKVTASGSYKPSPNTTITWSGGTNLVSKDSAFPANGIAFSGVFNKATGFIDMFTLFSSGTFTRKQTSGTTTTTTQLAANTDGYLSSKVPFDRTSFVIPAGSAPPTLPLGTPDAVSATMTWTPAQPVNPPTDNVQRGPG